LDSVAPVTEERQPDPLASVRDELAELERGSLRRNLREATGPAGARMRVDGAQVINFCSNNYLDLAGHHALRAAASLAAEHEGVGAGAARLIGGNFDGHRELERRLAVWKGTERALLFGSGYQANLGILGALAGPEDAIFSDRLNHASLVDGARLSRATVHVYPHNDLEELERDLRTARHHRRRIIVTESVFSMDGDIAAIAELGALARQYGALLVVDEAHAAGLLGPRGIGLAAGGGAHVQMGTLGKAFGGAGAYAAGAGDVIELLLNRARSFVFTTAPAPPAVAAAAAALELVASAEGDDRRRTLFANAAHLGAGLVRLGVRMPPSAPGHIVPIVVGESHAAVQLSERLFERGLFVQAIRPPTVPDRGARLRITVSSGHTREDIDCLLAALGDLLPGAPP
jgi:8-amino-7-oxononanoate synthase